MIYNDSSKWIDFTNHILQWEGKTSKDPKDTASKCVDAGKIHTNKGVTYCTFKDNALRLNITPVTYERFLNLSNEDVAKFIYSYYKNVNGQSFADSIALALTESAWGSGTERAYKHLFDALKELGQDAKTKAEAVINASKVPEKVLFDLYLTKRRQYLEFLGKSPKYSKFIKGWLNRFKSFYTNFNPINSDKKKNNAFTLADFISNIFNF